MTWTHRSLVAAAISVLLAASSSSNIASAAPPVSFTDPDDVNLPLDLKTLTHEHNDSTITYTVETYDPFNDSTVDFKWAVDKDGDQKVDFFASAGYEEKELEGKVEDTNDKELGKATIRRVNDRSLQLSFSRKLLGGSYQYWVMAATDSNGNEEDDPGEFDLAPDAGFHPHQL